MTSLRRLRRNPVGVAGPGSLDQAMVQRFRAIAWRQWKQGRNRIAELSRRSASPPSPPQMSPNPLNRSFLTRMRRGVGRAELRSYRYPNCRVATGGRLPTLPEHRLILRSNPEGLEQPG